MGFTEWLVEGVGAAAFFTLSIWFVRYLHSDVDTWGPLAYLKLALVLTPVCLIVATAVVCAG